jgi:hypothetical protein
MIQYKLIKEYPGSPKLGTIEFNDYNITEPYVRHSTEWKGTIFYDAHPEFWQKLEELDYEILGFFNKMNKRVYHFDKASKSFCSIDGFHNNVNYEYCLKYYVITSVKRLSDGEVFTIGDTIANMCDSKQKISELYVNKNDGKMCVYTSTTCRFTIKSIKKVKTPLFTTEGGVEIFEGNEYWYVVTFQHNIGHEWKPLNHVADWNGNAELMKPPLGGKQFSTKEEAEKWVLFNKPCLSINEIGVNLPEGNLLQLLNIVKSKL